MSVIEAYGSGVGKHFLAVLQFFGNAHNAVYHNTAPLAETLNNPLSNA